MSIWLQNFTLIQPRTSPLKFARMAGAATAGRSGRRRAARGCSPWTGAPAPAAKVSRCKYARHYEKINNSWDGEFSKFAFRLPATLFHFPNVVLLISSDCPFDLPRIIPSALHCEASRRWAFNGSGTTAASPACEGDAANFTGLVLGCIETRFCK